MNCAHCHIDGGYAEFYPVRLEFTPIPDYNALGVCVEPNININGIIGQEADHIIAPGNPLKSVLYHRMNTDLEMIKMPMIGRSLIHEEGVTLVTNWISEMEGDCL